VQQPKSASGTRTNCAVPNADRSADATASHEDFFTIMVAALASSYVLSKDTDVIYHGYVVSSALRPNSTCLNYASDISLHPSQHHTARTHPHIREWSLPAGVQLGPTRVATETWTETCHDSGWVYLPWNWQPKAACAQINLNRESDTFGQTDGLFDRSNATWLTWSRHRRRFV